ncbi:hypothetical protein, partial [Candidatus Mycoplasma haematohominis]|uniref:hypothetical protein n=1 Tax=Candidatus Mycoplasma haematohominis TaxID=1494318 RepID=UPI001C0A7519
VSGDEPIKEQVEVKVVDEHQPGALPLVVEEVVIPITEKKGSEVVVLPENPQVNESEALSDYQDEEEKPKRTEFSIDGFNDPDYEDPQLNYLDIPKVANRESLNKGGKDWEEFFEDEKNSIIENHLSALQDITKVEITKDHLKKMSVPYGSAWLRRGCWHVDITKDSHKALWSSVCTFFTSPVSG